eukprot:CAMPEP_0201219754 /NCGR_PEP_ID=MMETSP0851-20130426/191236_1 /ASSEMBLY_ACC=CAM_ASM_000631 /TAXON_ID=183588 /ORGANISM="Pseudo-nitzschia fraudulenta, Strain WWA7" /LENGTH=36 /DNA_ID= /DNA_START= /DNA_END= /DNA_ORIENTATION=
MICLRQKKENELVSRIKRKKKLLWIKKKKLSLNKKY